VGCRDGNHGAKNPIHSIQSGQPNFSPLRIEARNENRPLIANQIITGILFAVAILAATIRTPIRVRLKHHLFLSDAFLILACMALTATTIIMYKGLAGIEYTDELLIRHKMPEV